MNNSRPSRVWKIAFLSVALVFCLFLMCRSVRSQEYVKTYSALWNHVTKQARVDNKIIAYATKEMIDVKDSSYPATVGANGLEVKLLDDVSNNRWTTKIESEAQRFAMREAKLMARIGRDEHFLGIAPGGDVAGVGEWYTPQCPTCEGDAGMVLIADAVAYSPRTNKWYRHRTFKYSEKQNQARADQKARAALRETKVQASSMQVPRRRFFFRRRR